MIREATEADIPALVELGHQLHLESDYAGYLGYDRDKVTAGMVNALENENALLLIGRQDGETTGGMWAFIGEHLFSHDLIAGDMALYVPRKYRGGMTGPQLIKRYVEWARSKGVALQAIRIGITNGIHVEQTGKLYERLGFVRDGITYHHEG